MLHSCRADAICVAMENAAETTAPVASRQRAHRSAVSNGTKLFCVDGLDGRSQPARRFRDLVESVEADFIRNLAFDSEAYGVLCDRLGRCLQRLGLERVARPVNDGSQALAEYFSRPPPKEA